MTSRRKNRIPRKINGSKLLGRRTTKRTVLDQLTRMDARISKLMVQTGKNLSILEERSMLSWEMFWGLMLALEKEGIISAEKLDASRKEVRKKWELEARVERNKKLLEDDQCLCLSCAAVAPAESFIGDTGFKCAKCECTDEPYSKEDSDDSVSEPVQVSR